MDDANTACNGPRPAAGLKQRNLSVRARHVATLYLPTIIAAGILVIIASLLELAEAPVDERWFVLAGLTVLSGSATLRIPGIPVSFSISDSFTMAAALLWHDRD